MPFDQIGRLLIIFGVVIVVVGLALFALGRTSGGRLPGDFTFNTGNVTCVVPLATMLIVSLILTIVLNVIIRLFNR